MPPVATTWNPSHTDDLTQPSERSPFLPRLPESLGRAVKDVWRHLTCQHGAHDSFAAGPARGQAAAAAIKGMEGLGHVLDGSKTHRKAITSNKDERKHIEHMAQNHAPEFMIIECCDARYNAAKALNTKMGQLFEFKTLGAVVPPGAKNTLGIRAAIEYGTQALGVKRIIVLGHTGCGLVKALLDPSQAKGLPATSAYIKLLSSLRQSIDDRFATMSAQDLALAAVGEAVLFSKRQIEALPEVTSSGIEVYAMVYELSNLGAVSLYDEETDEFLPINADRSELPRRNAGPPTTVA